MKLSTLMMIMIAIQLVTLLFGMNHSNTALFGFIQNPTDWSNNVFLIIFGTIAAGVTLVGAFVGTFIYGKTDLMVFAGAILVLLGFMVPVASLWQTIYGEIILPNESCVISAWKENCTGGFVASLFTAPLAILAVFTIVNWWRGNSEM